MRHAFFALLAAALATACVKGSKEVRSQAARDLQCNEGQIEVQKISTNNYRAYGCGKEQSYVCSGNVNDDFCHKN